MSRMRDWLQRELVLQRRWIAEHGATLPGYVARYGSENDPDHYGAGGENIYKADTDALARFEKRLR